MIHITNVDREFVTLAANLTKNGATRRVYARELNWDAESLELSPNAQNLSYTYNREGFSELHLRQTKPTPATRSQSSGDEIFGNYKEIVDVPAKGIVGGLKFSPDGSRLAFTFSSAKYNPDVWIYDLNAKKFTQLTHSDRAGLDQNSFVEPQLIKFKSFDGREIPAWFYRPQTTVTTKTGTLSATMKPPVKENLPVIVSVHGGPEAQERAGFNALYQYYLSRGYAILATNVRGSTGYGKTFTHLDDVRRREDSVKDLAAAAYWLRTDGGADVKKIAVIGGSYGGYMTLAAITLYPDLWAAAVDTVGIANWETFLQRTSGYRRRQREVEYGRLDKDLDFLREISPINRVDRIKTPLFVIQGKRDPRVPYTESEQIVESLRKRNAPVEYKLFDDEGHGVNKLKNRLVVYPLVADFLDKHLSGK